MSYGDFKKQKPDFNLRRSEALAIMEKYPDRVPVVVERAPTSSHQLLDKSKYLIPRELIATHLHYVIRKRLKLPDHAALYLFVNGATLISGAHTLDHVYNLYKDRDAFLYIAYTDEATFGSRQKPT
jgi:GABA(A) receptor-associated protein